MSLEPEIEKTENLIACAQELEKKFRSDPHRPKYHFMPPSAWMNDINEAIFWKGRYHIFYQHNPEGGYWKWMQWGHASSINLVHWGHHPIALKPTLDGPDRNGCFSGGAFISKEGIPTFIYYGVPDGTCLASSEDDMLINWSKHSDNPVTPEPIPDNPDFGKYTIHDPSAWLDGDVYYQITNRRNTDGKGDATYLFRANDLNCWEYVGLFYQSDRSRTEFDEDCAVPDFFPLGDKYMLLFCSHLQGTQYYLGQLQNELYYPETHGRMSWPGGQLGGARTLLDSTGRRIFFDWVRELQGSERERASGLVWSYDITQRIYPTRSDSVGISLFSSDGSVNVKTIQAWDMAPANN